MQEDETLKRDGTIRAILLGILILAIATTIVLSKRPVFIGLQSGVVPGAPIADRDLPPDYARAMDGYGVHILKLGRQRKIPMGVPISDLTDEKPRLKFGYSFYERDVLAMPFLVRKQHGHVIYYENDAEFVVVPVTDDYLRQVRIKTAKPLDDGDFPLWPHAWGWLFVIAIGGIGLFELGAQRRRREISGIM
ncbi:MAG: hypothetical protein V4564_15020 [Pseudomonadota bacterium]|uniref:hypothetical protein n=1 Tax=Sphingomonas sp. ERG5 TaxID=1381597 RepID=UPI00054BAC4C|nr:hypothetical protein [Sphingomonas sp. ERG5]